MNKKIIIDYLKWFMDKRRVSTIFDDRIYELLDRLIYNIENENFNCYICGFTNGSNCYETQKQCEDDKCINKVCGFCYNSLEDKYIFNSNSNSDLEIQVCVKGCKYE